MNIREPSGDKVNMDREQKILAAANELSYPARLEGLAEEATEVAQAALKLARVIRGENPTPKKRAEAVLELIEELSDLELCRMSVGLEYDEETIDKKLDRWLSRLAEHKS